MAGTIDVKDWSETDDFHAVCKLEFQPFNTWLGELKEKYPEPADFLDWIPEVDVHEKVLDVKHEVAEFWLLTQVVPMNDDRDLFVALDPRVRFISQEFRALFSPYEIEGSKLRAAFAPIYKSIRRQITTRFFSCRKQWVANLSSQPILYAIGCPVQINESGCAQALAVWRAYYESTIDASQYHKKSREAQSYVNLIPQRDFDELTGRNEFFSLQFSQILETWDIKKLALLSQLVMAHFYAVCGAINAYLEDEARLDRPASTPTEIVSRAQHRFNNEVAVLNVHWLRGAKEFVDLWGAPGFSLSPQHRFFPLHKRRLLSFNSRCGDVLLQRDVSHTEASDFGCKRFTKASNGT